MLCVYNYLRIGSLKLVYIMIDYTIIIMDESTFKNKKIIGLDNERLSSCRYRGILSIYNIEIL